MTVETFHCQSLWDTWSITYDYNHFLKWCFFACWMFECLLNPNPQKSKSTENLFPIQGEQTYLNLNLNFGLQRFFHGVTQKSEEEESSNSGQGRGASVFWENEEEGFLHQHEEICVKYHEFWENTPLQQQHASRSAQ